MGRLTVLTLIFSLITVIAWVQVKAVEDIGNEICPVSGEKIDEKFREKYEYKGKVYSFCCLGCVEDFKKDPERYIEKMEKTGDGKGDEKHHHHHHHTH